MNGFYFYPVLFNWRHLHADELDHPLGRIRGDLVAVFKVVNTTVREYKEVSCPFGSPATALFLEFSLDTRCRECEELVGVGSFELERFFFDFGVNTAQHFVGNCGCGNCAAHVLDELVNDHATFDHWIVEVAVEENTCECEDVGLIAVHAALWIGGNVASGPGLDNAVNLFAFAGEMEATTEGYAEGRDEWKFEVDLEKILGENLLIVAFCKEVTDAG